MQIAGYTLLENHEDYNEFVEDLEDSFKEDFKNFYLCEPEQYPVCVRPNILGFYIETIQQDDLKELYNKLHEIFGKES